MLRMLMLPFLTMFSTPPAQAGACNCGQAYYLAHAEGKTDVKTEYPNDCAGDEGGEGSFDCLMIDAWNPHASGESAHEQRQTFERILAIAEK
ncbi:MAG: hypothetical protein GWP91_10820 [Rhodobacterales bacterium]|nr:hypothetical protein [Rhodobacterales bacterium]